MATSVPTSRRGLERPSWEDISPEVCKTPQSAHEASESVSYTPEGRDVLLQSKRVVVRDSTRRATATRRAHRVEARLAGAQEGDLRHGDGGAEEREEREARRREHAIPRGNCRQACKVSHSRWER